MKIEGLFNVSQFGLSYERLRLEAAIRNISQANVAIVNGKSPLLAQVTAVSTGTGFSNLVSGVPAMHISEHAAGTREVHDPSNPIADSKGNVQYADVNMASEMTGLMSASRAYEANIRGFNMLEQMTEKALQIGGR